MRSTWTDSRLDDFTAETGRRFDMIDGELHEIRSELGALQRTIIGVGGGLIAAVVGVIATQL